MVRVPDLGELVAGRYRIQALAREGPGYVTLHAFDCDVEVEVSLLWFRAGLFPTAEARRNFLGDGVNIRGVAHPHLRRVYDAHLFEENAFATAQVGSTMLKWLGGARPADELDVIRYATSIGEGLDAAHRLGHVHGYLVPSDVIEVASQVKISGVGLYRAASRDVARDLFWTRRRYLAPEVVAGGEPTVRSDVYSMAALLAEIASGVSTAEIGDALAEAANAHPRLVDVLRRALSPEPGERHATARAALRQLRGHLVDDRVPTVQQAAVQAPLPDTARSQEVVIDAEEPPESVARREKTVRRPMLTRRLLDAESFDTSPISLLNADGDPMALPTDADERAVVKAEVARQTQKQNSWSSPWSGRDPNSSDYGHIGDKTVEIDFTSKTREYRIDPLLDEDSSVDHPRAPSEDDQAASKTSTDETTGETERASVMSSAAPIVADSDVGPALSAEQLSARDPLAAQAGSIAATLPKPPPIAPEPRVEFTTPKGGSGAVGSPAAQRSAEISAPPDPFGAASVALDPSPRTIRGVPPPASVVPAPAMFAGARPQPAASAVPSGQRRQQSPLVSANQAPERLAEIDAQGPYRPFDPHMPDKPPNAAVWLWAAAAVVAVVLCGLLAVIFIRSTSTGAVPPPDAMKSVAIVRQIDAAPAPDAPRGPCAGAMVLAEPNAEAHFCVDKFEAADEQGLPRVEVTVAEARAACSDRGARLCTTAEWTSACRGADRSAYPYGRRYQRDACNASFSRRQNIERGGNFPECESEAGAFDMSGNVGEWTEDGLIQGGSARDLSGGRCSRRFRGRAERRYPDVGYRCCSDPLAQD